MRLRIVSDVHLEQFVHRTTSVTTKWDEYVAPIREHDAESVLILAGDICEFGYITHYAQCWKDLATRFKAVVYVPGNHEYCGATTPYGPQTFFYFKELLRQYGKIYLLDNTSIVIDGQKFYGTSLWTNYDNNPVAPAICSGMWDFRYGRTYEGNEARTTTPYDYIDRHAIAVEKLAAEIAKGDDMVVISHFAPSFKSIHDRYKGMSPAEINYHFVNDMDQTILDGENVIKLWIHGHTHSQFNYLVGTTPVICNPLGFPGEETSKREDLDYVEISRYAN